MSFYVKLRQAMMKSYYSEIIGKPKKNKEYYELLKTNKIVS